MPVPNSSDFRFSALPGAISPSLSSTEQVFVARLSRPKLDTQAQRESRLTAEAASLLSELASEMATEDVALSGNVEPVPQHTAEASWVMHGRDVEHTLWLQGAIDFAKKGSEARHPEHAELVPQRPSRLARWLSFWHGTPGMQTF